MAKSALHGTDDCNCCDKINSKPLKEGVTWKNEHLQLKN